MRHPIKRGNADGIVGTAAHGLVAADVPRIAR